MEITGSSNDSDQSIHWKQYYDNAEDLRYSLSFKPSFNPFIDHRLASKSIACMKKAKSCLRSSPKLIQLIHGSIGAIATYSKQLKFPDSHGKANNALGKVDHKGGSTA